MVVAMATPWRCACGVAHYAKRLVEALRASVEVEVVPLELRAGRGWRDVWEYRCHAAAYREQGRRMNRGEVAHVQFQYFLFGGVAPWKIHFLSFLREVKRPVVLTIHEIDGGTGRRRLYLRWLNRRLFGPPYRAHYFVHTEAYREVLQGLGVPSDRISVVPMPLPDPLPLPDPVEAKAFFGLSGRRVLTIFGFIAQRKGYELALEALSQLPSDVTLLIAGSRHFHDRTDYMDRLEQIIAERGLQNRVVITGYLGEPEVARALAASDLVLAPFTAMSGSASVATSLAYGRPVLASDLPPNRTVQQESPCLELFRAGDAQDLLIHLEDLLADAPRRAALSAQAEAYRQAHRFDHLAQATAAVYEQVLKGIRGGAEIRRPH